MRAAAAVVSLSGTTQDSACSAPTWRVRVARLPPLAGPKTGPEDFIAAGHDARDIEALPSVPWPDDVRALERAASTRELVRD